MSDESDPGRAGPTGPALGRGAVEFVDTLIGMGALAWQRAQVKRREFEAAVSSTPVIGPKVQAVSSQLKRSGAAALREADRAAARIGAGLSDASGPLPDPARSVVRAVLRRHTELVHHNIEWLIRAAGE